MMSVFVTVLGPPFSVKVSLTLPSGLSSPNFFGSVADSVSYFVAVRLPSSVSIGCALRNGTGAVKGPVSFQLLPSRVSVKESAGLSRRVISAAARLIRADRPDAKRKQTDGPGREAIRGRRGEREDRAAIEPREDFLFLAGSRVADFEPVRAAVAEGQCHGELRLVQAVLGGFRRRGGEELRRLEVVELAHQLGDVLRIGGGSDGGGELPGVVVAFLLLFHREGIRAGYRDPREFGVGGVEELAAAIRDRVALEDRLQSLREEGRGQPAF